MKKCYKCNVLINSVNSTCPLCQSSIDSNEKTETIFPIIPNIYIKHNLIFKLSIFLSIFGCILCTMINYLINKEIGWSLFVIAGIISFWITFVTGIKRRHNFMRLLFAETIIVLISSILWDYFTGWYFWSITYVLPFLCIAYITILFVLRIFIKNIFKDYIIYFYVNSLIGLIPLYFILKDKLVIEWPSILCIIFSIFSILILAIFNHRQMKNEFQRRFHI